MSFVVWRACNHVRAKVARHLLISSTKLSHSPFRNWYAIMEEQPSVNKSNLFSLPRLSSSDFQNIQKEVTFKALKIPTKVLGALMKNGLKRKAYKRTNFNFVRKGEDGEFCHILLDPEAARRFESWKGCRVLQENQIEPTLTDYKVTLTYKDFTAEEILRAILPEGVDVPTAFSRIGHIAHINLREDQLEHKYLIGKVMLDKNHAITTVVNKTSEISNRYRVFNMEILAGKEDFITTVREHHCTFELDFSKVYWNPRLSTEHERIVSKVRGQVMFDVFAGIGPFAIPAAKKGSQVFANDLNPDSYYWLQRNAKINRVIEKIETFNLDGRAFITSVVRDKVLEYGKRDKSDRPVRVHVVMNLPASAVEFLDAFRGLFSECASTADADIPPMSVHCYCFSKAEDPQRDAAHVVERRLGCNIPYPDVHNVRNVAPNKEMMCVSFEVPLSILWAQREQREQEAVKRSVSDDPTEEDDVSKRQKLE